MYQPGKPDASADLQNPATARYRCGTRPPVACPRRPHRRAGNQLWARSCAGRTLPGSSSLPVTRKRMPTWGRRPAPPDGRPGPTVIAAPGSPHSSTSPHHRGWVHPLTPCRWHRRPQPRRRRCWCSRQPQSPRARQRARVLQAQLSQDPSQTRRMLIVDGPQPLESSGRQLLALYGEARTSWRGPQARTSSWPCFRPARPFPPGSIRAAQ